MAVEYGKFRSPEIVRTGDKKTVDREAGNAS